MIRIAITADAFEAIAAMLPLGSVGYEAQLDAQGRRLIWLERAIVDRLRAMRGPGESYSDAILRLVEPGRRAGRYGRPRQRRRRGARALGLSSSQRSPTAQGARQGRLATIADMSVGRGYAPLRPTGESNSQFGATFNPLRYERTIPPAHRVAFADSA